jgi:hypothetical protein
VVDQLSFHRFEEASGYGILEVLYLRKSESNIEISDWPSPKQEKFV